MPYTPISAVSLSPDLEDIPGLEPYGVCYYRPGRVAVCICCKTAIRHPHIYGHIVSYLHWRQLRVGKKPSKAAIAALLNDRDFISANESVNLPPGPLAPFPFLKLFPDDDPPEDRDNSGWYCNAQFEGGRPCNFCCRRKNTIQHHISDVHGGESVEKTYRMKKKLFTKGHVQKFFQNREGSSYFRVTPVLTGVEPEGDFSVWYASLTEVDRCQELAASALFGDTDDVGADISPFLSKAGWISQLEGYSWHDLMTRTMRLKAHERLALGKLPQLARAYLHSISQAEVTRSVHPVNLSALNHWKKYVISLVVTCRFLLKKSTSRLPFQLLTNVSSIYDYARVAARLALFVIREADTEDGTEEVYKEISVPHLRQTLEGHLEDKEMDEEMDGILALAEEEDDDDDDGENELVDDEVEDGYESDGHNSEFSDNDDEAYEDIQEDMEGCSDDEYSELDRDDNRGDDAKRYPVLLTDEQRLASRELRNALARDSTEDELLQLFHNLVLTIFTSQPHDAERNRFHMPIEAFIIGSNLRADGSYRKAVNLAPDLSKLQYLTQFSVLRDAMISGSDISQYV